MQRTTVCLPVLVVPHEGTWIEMLIVEGSKHVVYDVVPHEGTWIEMWTYGVKPRVVRRRSPRGNVD